MFGKTRVVKRDGSGAPDEPLSALLRQWQGVEPAPGFEAAVWRRLRPAPAERPASAWDPWFAVLLPHPVWAGAAAVLIALATGLASGIALPGRAYADAGGTHALLHPRTLMGTYVALAEGGHP